MKTNIRIVHWIPRIFCILAILFISMFALDSFASHLTIGQQIGRFLIHLTPTYILVALLIVAWKWELIGGILFFLLGIGFSPVVYNMNHHRNHSVMLSLGIVLTVAFPFILVGGLFMLSDLLKKKQSRIPANEKIMAGKQAPSISVDRP